MNCIVDMDPLTNLKVDCNHFTTLTMMHKMRWKQQRFSIRKMKIKIISEMLVKYLVTLEHFAASATLLQLTAFLITFCLSA